MPRATKTGFCRPNILAADVGNKSGDPAGAFPAMKMHGQGRRQMPRRCNIE